MNHLAKELCRLKIILTDKQVSAYVPDSPVLSNVSRSTTQPSSNPKLYLMNESVIAILLAMKLSWVGETEINHSIQMPAEPSN